MEDTCFETSSSWASSPVRSPAFAALAVFLLGGLALFALGFLLAAIAPTARFASAAGFAAGRLPARASSCYIIPGEAA